MLARPLESPPPAARGLRALLAATLAALLASSCCVLPLVLTLVGISGAWIGQLHGLTPYSPWLTAGAVLALGLAAWQIYRRPTAVAEGCCGLQDDACQRSNRWLRRAFWGVLLLTALPLLLPLVAPWFY